VARPVPRRALVLAAALAPLSCVLWPEGAGPAAAAVPLAEALVLQGRGEAVLVDIRRPEHYATGHIPGAVNVPAKEIERQPAAIRKLGRLPILYCGG
jgi:hypothetical protein